MAEQSDPEWVQAQKEGKQSFFNGMYQVRLEDITPGQGATIGLYSGTRKLGETQVVQGKVSSDIYLPGSFCRAGIRAELLGYELGKERATLRIAGTQGTETVDVYQGSTFLQGACRVQRLHIDNRTGRTGYIEVKCAQLPVFKLQLLNSAGAFELFADPTDANKLLIPDEEGALNFGDRTPAYQSGKFKIGDTGNLLRFNDTLKEWKEVSTGGSSEQARWYATVRTTLREYIQALGKKSSSGSSHILRERNYSADIEANFSATIAAYRLLVQEFPAEKGDIIPEPYGEQALQRAVELARAYGKQATQAVLLQELITTYPDADNRSRYQQQLTQLQEIDGSESNAVLSLRGGSYTLSLMRLTYPTRKPKVHLQIANQPVTLEVGTDGKAVYDGFGQMVGSGREKTANAFIRVTSLDAETVTFSTNCAYDIRRTTGSSLVQTSSGVIRSVPLREQDDGTFCGVPVRVASIEAEKVARIRLSTTAERTEGVTNVSVQIGIEKRAIQLSPAKTAERIANLNKSIQRWEQLNKNLEKVVTTMKAACFATAGVLTVKNFFTSLSGKGFARKQAMEGVHGWTEKCKKEIASSAEVRTFDQCYLKYASEIEKDVDARAEIVKQVNAKVMDIQKNSLNPSTGLFGDSIDTEKARKAYLNFLQEDSTFRPQVQNMSLEHASYTQLREVHMNLLLQQRTDGTLLQSDAEAKIEAMQKDLTNQKELDNNLRKEREKDIKGDIPSTVVSAQSQLPRQAPIISEKAAAATKQPYYGKNSSEPTYKYYTKVTTTASEDKSGRTYASETYGLGLVKEGNLYVVKDVFTANGTPLDPGEKERVISQYNLASFTDSASEIWEGYSWKNPEVQYYETDPYKGLPALVPVDPDHGWYAATKQTLPAFGGLAGWESSGRVASFYLCNVGKNSLPDVFNGYSDDMCVLINLASGQPVEKVPGVSEARAVQLVKDARQALEDAALQHGNKRVTLKSGTYDAGKPAVSVPAVQCQLFMSAQECNLLFNVCDPVICPASRCDFGGKYPVQDVIQSGIVGSTLLCLPNFPDVKIPLCLSGIHAGIDAYTSILQAHRACLQESLTSGRMVGICDQIYSIYSCEFFWRQLSPLTNLLVPKLFEQAQGQGTRGGGEYLTVQNAWQNAKQSTDYFTQVYGVNAFKAFQARNAEEVGSQVCKGFISAQFPTNFKSLIQADSPVQFTASFSTTRFSDATVPATSQYKVFYHIYAGKDQGVSYRVYLKNPPATSYYASQPTLHVDSGFIGKGQFRDETKDFTAPEGYQQLCVMVNGDERCGFKQVSTSFAINRLRDQIVQNELQDKEVKTEQECVSGSPNGAALLNPNLGQMADELADPALYRRGIVRICASSNPGQTTDPSRFTQVGICGDAKLKCWLDRKSIADAITPNNKGVLNATYQWFANNTLANLEEDKTVLGEKAGRDELSRLEGVVKGLETKNARLTPAEVTRVGQLFNEFEQTKRALFYNHHRARLGWVVGRAQEVLFKHVFAVSADDTRQAGQLDKGILVRENKGVWEIKVAQIGVWERADSYTESDTEKWTLLSPFQQTIVAYLQEKTADSKDADILGKHHYLRDQPGVTVTADKLTDADGYYYVPFGDVASSSGTPADPPARTPTPPSSGGGPSANQPLDILLQDVDPSVTTFIQTAINGNIQLTRLFYAGKQDTSLAFYVSRYSQYYLYVNSSATNGVQRIGTVTDSGITILPEAVSSLRLRSSYESERDFLYALDGGRLVFEKPYIYIEFATKTKLYNTNYTLTKTWRGDLKIYDNSTKRKYTDLYISRNILYFDGQGFGGNADIGSLDSGIISIDVTKYQQVAEKKYKKVYYETIHGSFIRANILMRKAEI
ncbi:hypothetical protein FJZ22_01820 [Candidatus Pacearchaeota archaeon]|nr:hypothetical protein [Candidatus Pacearchaeota archaeon]